MTNITEMIAKNIKQRRKELHITQNDLAFALGYSTKAISKWESGKGAPPTVILPALAAVLHMNVDDLLSMNVEGKFFLGIDGGGTKTEFALADSEGNIIRNIVLGTSNPSDIGIDASLNVIKEGISEVCANIPKSNISIFAGLAGGTTEGVREQITEFLSRFGFASVKNGSDAMNAVSASLGSGDGITVIMGTGSVTFAQVNGKSHRVGGYGYLLGDAGSGFSLGREAILAALCFEDGSGEETSLYESVRKRCGTERVLDSLGEFYRGGKRTIAQYAPLVLNAYVEDDRVAKKILFADLEKVAQTIRGAAKYLPSGKAPIRVELCGGLCTKDDIIAGALREILAKENYSVNLCKNSLIIGALRLAGMPDKEND
ncbi:MAG: XRE family transcriptional regulator [Ruminococcaceae bacterium]|nr:XRE family transcriptional regulator [Oscillospiraceae bacterium]